MRLKNKKTGEIIDDGYVRETHDFQFDGQKHVLAVFKGNGHRPPERVSGAYTSLAELNEEWEDAPEEPKNPCFINWFGEVSELLGHISDREIEKLKEAGNYFETKEEAEKAVEKLKAWKRVKRDLVSLNWQRERDGNFSVWGEFKTGITLRSDVFLDNHSKDLDLLFGGKE